MKMCMYVVFDKKSLVYQAPVCFINDQEAERGFVSFLGRRPESMMSQFPEDYQLYFCGEFNDGSGCVVGSELRFVCEMKSLVRSYENGVSKT